MTKPISPYEAQLAFTASMPSFVIDAFNEQLTAKFGMLGRVTIDQAEIVKLILVKAAEKGYPEVTKADIFARKWLDVEEAFRSAGWFVKHYNQCVGDSTPSYYSFEPNNQTRGC